MPTDNPEIRAYLDRLIPVAEYAKMIDVSAVEVYRRLKDGRLDGEDFGRGKRPMKLVLLPEEPHGPPTP